MKNFDHYCLCLNAYGTDVIIIRTVSFGCNYCDKSFKNEKDFKKHK